METGDRIELIFATDGWHSGIKVNGVDLPDARRMRLETSAEDLTVLSVECLLLPPNGTHIFHGYFVQEEDMRAFREWKKCRRGEK